jgi:hypothetical protein
MSAAALAEASPGRFVLYIGISSPVVVEHRNVVAFNAPWRRARNTLRFLKRVLGR